jgi:hypothetical protein
MITDFAVHPQVSHNRFPMEGALVCVGSLDVLTKHWVWLCLNLLSVTNCSHVYSKLLDLVCVFESPVK